MMCSDYYTTNASVLSYNVIWYVCIFCIAWAAAISATVTPIGTRVCTTVELRPRTVFSPLSKCEVKERAQVDHFWPLRHRSLPFDREYLENVKSQRYMPTDLDINSTGPF